jgi:hypothetical protein
MLWESIVKSPRDRKVIPNLSDYGVAYLTPTHP